MPLNTYFSVFLIASPNSFSIPLPQPAVIDAVTAAAPCEKIPRLELQICGRDAAHTSPASSVKCGCCADSTCVTVQGHDPCSRRVKPQCARDAAFLKEPDRDTLLQAHVLVLNMSVCVSLSSH